IVRCRPPNQRDLSFPDLAEISDEAIDYCASFSQEHSPIDNILEKRFAVRCDQSHKKIHLNYSVAKNTNFSSFNGPCNNATTTKEFEFHDIFAPLDTQAALYEGCVLPLVEAAVDGFAGTIFAYGATGSGKTHTILGDMENCLIELSENAGIIQRVCEDIFKLAHGIVVQLSYLEIYNEFVYDLQSITEEGSQKKEGLSL
ncbi:kinesin motor protein cin8, partial [Nowakowskiella sp. JEL0078]